MPTPPPAILSVRVNPAERDLLAAAADHAHTTLSDFIRRKALEAAEVEVLGQQVVRIPAKDWDKFEAWVREPPRDNPALRALAARPPAWRE